MLWPHTWAHKNIRNIFMAFYSNATYRVVVPADDDWVLVVTDGVLKNDWVLVVDRTSHGSEIRAVWCVAICVRPIYMMTSPNEDIFRVTGLCARNSQVTGEFPAQRPVTRSFDVLFDLRLNKRLSKQLCGWWFETPSSSLWRHCNDIGAFDRLNQGALKFWFEIETGSLRPDPTPK